MKQNILHTLLQKLIHGRFGLSTSKAANSKAIGGFSFGILHSRSVSNPTSRHADQESFFLIPLTSSSIGQ
jgi:hypothetical protein